MAEYEVASVVWYERDDQIYVTYDQEEPDHMVATRSVASELARDAGLTRVPAPAGESAAGFGTRGPRSPRKKKRSTRVAAGSEEFQSPAP